MRRSVAGLAVALGALASCQLLSGVGDLVVAGAGGATSTSVASGASSSSGPGGCAPGATVDCYDGAKGTLGKGACKAGKATCNADGSLGPCQGEIVPRPEDCVTPGDEDCDGQAPACSGALSGAWTLATGAPSEIAAIAVDRETHDVVIAGQYLGQVALDGKPLPYAPSWDVFVARLAAGTTHALWITTLGGNDVDRATSVAIDPSGHAIVGGRFRSTDLVLAGTPVPNHGGADAFLARVDGGSVVWSASRGTPTDDGVVGVATDDAGNVYDAGQVGPDVFFELRDAASGTLVRGAQPWGGAGTHTLTAMSEVRGIRRVFAIGGALQGTLALGSATMTASSPAAWVAVVDAFAGSADYARAFPIQGAGSAAVGALAVDDLARATIVGPFQGSLPLGALGVAGGGVFVAGLDPNGEPRWARKLSPSGAPSDVTIAHATADDAGNLVLAGSYAGAFAVDATKILAPPGPRAPLALKLAQGDGALVWTQLFLAGAMAPPANAAATSVAIDPHASPIVAGLTFVPIAGQAPGGAEAGFFARMEP